MKSMIATLLMLAMVLSGCTTDDSGSEPDALETQPDGTSGADEPSSTGGTQTPSETTSSGNQTGAEDGAEPTTDAPNTLPEATLEASATEIEVPADVVFTLNGTDADGDELSWTLDADGDGVVDSEGSTLPFNFTFSYTAVGNYTAVFNLTDGEGAVAATTTIVATEAQAAGSDFPFTVSLDVLVPCNHCFYVGMTEACVGYQVGESGYDCAWAELPPGAGGRAFTAAGVSDADIVFLSTCDGEVLGVYDTEGNEAGSVPAGSGCAVVSEFVDTPATIVLTIS